MSLTMAGVDSALQTVAKIFNNFKDATAYYSNQSLPDVTKLTRVEPLVIISKDCMTLEYCGAIQQSLLTIFCAHYLQSIDFMCKVQNVNVVKILDRLNPNRDESGFLMTERVSRESATLSQESFKWSLDQAKNRLLSLEHSEDTLKANRELVDLSIGKQLNVQLVVPQTDKSGNNLPGSEPQTIDLMVNVRLIASSVPNATLVHLLSRGAPENDFTERFQTWLSRSGRIRFVQDLIFCQDLIDEAKRAAIADKSGTMQEVIRRVANAKKYGVLTKNPSMAAASSLYVISKAIAQEIEAKVGSFRNAKARESVFDKTYAMVIAVVDPEWENVTFYTRGIEKGTEVSVRELKSAAQRKGTDIADVMKMLSVGSQLSL